MASHTALAPSKCLSLKSVWAFGQRSSSIALSSMNACPIASSALSRDAPILQRWMVRRWDQHAVACQRRQAGRAKHRWPVVRHGPCGIIAVIIPIPWWFPAAMNQYLMSLWNQGEAHFKQKNWDAARACYQGIIELQPKDVPRCCGFPWCSPGSGSTGRRAIRRWRRMPVSRPTR